MVHATQLSIMLSHWKIQEFFCLFFLQGKRRVTRSFVWRVPDEGAPVWNWALEMTLHLHKCVWVSWRAIWSFINMQQSCFFRANICSAGVLFIEKQMQFDTMHLIIHNLPSASYLDAFCPVHFTLQLLSTFRMIPASHLMQDIHQQWTCMWSHQHIPHRRCTKGLYIIKLKENQY